MKLYKQLVFILVVFFKTGTLFSQNNLFNVNNIELKKKDKITNSRLADQAVRKGFDQLTNRILLKRDIEKLSDLKFSLIKQLVAYYQITNVSKENDKEELVNFSVTFDKDKIHDIFYKRGISYSEILDKELYILPLLTKENEIFIFNNNFFYENWNRIYDNDLIEFILPLENIEIIQKINNYENNLINLNVADLFQEYNQKNLALILIDKNKFGDKKIYIKSIIQGKKISKNLDLKKQKLSADKFNEKTIIEIKKELINIVKSKNLIDIRTPFFLNAKLELNKKSNLVKLNSRVDKIDSIENIYVQEFNKDYMKLKIKYLGNLEKIINQLNKENIELQLINDQWVIKTL
jgi:hypothetical protein|tara:strand:+ start:3131 stop:4177 length:1047 start_codon:yes stop_codon:yes gene_type:complete